MANERSTRRHKALRAEFRQQCENRRSPCHLCSQPIDYGVPKDNPDAFELDHFYPVSTHPALVDDPANFRPSHKSCNGSRGNAEVTPTLGSLSEEW
ncbi:HNH endonuclease [Rhodococcus erythropolis]|nr:HNH endonuclease [Rhodococcus erythropolis]THJ70723.1 HNH endonuclease [Rhodococcus qingshengii]